ncbi:MAG: hypothetical protein ABI939_11795 [Anaerolineaceae bacterium]
MTHGPSTFVSTGARQTALAGEPGALAAERRAVVTMVPTRLRDLRVEIWIAKVLAVIAFGGLDTLATR